MSICLNTISFTCQNNIPIFFCIVILLLLAKINIKLSTQKLKKKPSYLSAVIIFIHVITIFLVVTAFKGFRHLLKIITSKNIAFNS